MQVSEEERHLRMDEDRLIVGLTTNWGRKTQQIAVGDLPASYIAHLQQADETCEAVAGVAREDLSRKKAPDLDLRNFASDLSLMVDDCQKFGMGREIPLEILVQNNGIVEDGWTVFYKWLPGSSKYKVREVQFPSPTPKAHQNLWPGIYAVRAEKVVNGRKLESAIKTLPLGGNEKAVFTISLP
jgi:hypothetical protein